MRLNDRKIHRAEIKRRMRQIHKGVNQHRSALYNFFVASTILFAFGISLILESRSQLRSVGLILLSLGTLLFVSYKALLNAFKNSGHIHEWLKPMDLIIMALPIFISIARSERASDRIIMIAALSTSSVYGTWRLWKYSRPRWRASYFQVAREYLWEIKSFNPNYSVKRDAQKSARPLP